MVYRYALLAEEIDATPGHGGLAQVRSNDLAVAPGSVRFLTFLELDSSAVLTNNDGSGLQNAAFQCSTYDKLSYAFMHELGHTLGLAHGGYNDINNKPNYMSVMNYAYMSNFCGTLARLDYSDWTPPLFLLEGSLNEEHGLGGPLEEETADYLYGKQVAFGQALTVDEFARRTQGVELSSIAPPWNSNCVARNPRIRPGGAFGPDRLPMPIANADGWIDWDQNCRIDRVFVKADINAGFDDAGEAPDPAAEQLAGWDDWGNLDFNFRDDAYYQGGLYRVPARR